MKLASFCYEKGSYNQHRVRMHYVTGCLGTDFIRIPSVASKKKKITVKNQISLRKKKNWVIELDYTKGRLQAWLRLKF